MASFRSCCTGEGGLWRVDLVETWKNLFFDPDGNYFLRNSNTPYAYGLAAVRRGPLASASRRCRSAAARSPRSLARLDGTGRRRCRRYRRAEIRLRNAFLLPGGPRGLPEEAVLARARRIRSRIRRSPTRAMYLGFPGARDSRRSCECRPRLRADARGGMA